MSDFVTKEILTELLLTNAQSRVIKRESSTIEFKENFDWKNKAARIKYLRTVAAFANRKGGYLIFGVRNNPKEIVGIAPDFKEVDDADVSSFFNTYLSPSIEYERETVEIGGKLVGAIYIHECKSKPIICVKDYDNILAESTIYYRYNSQSDKIKSGDLALLLAEIKEQESQKWISLFQNVSKIGIENARVFNIRDGEISTSAGGRFILDEKLLSRLKILDKYSVNVQGAEAVRIIGDVDTTGTIITQSRYLYDSEIMTDYLEGNPISDAAEYIKAICFQSSGMLPFYYYVSVAGYNQQSTLDLISAVNKHSQAKTKLLSRIANDSKLDSLSNATPISAATSIGAQRRRFFDEMCLDPHLCAPDGERQIKSFLEAVTAVSISSVNMPALKSKLAEIVSAHYANRRLAPSIRNAVSYLDFLEHKNW